jgi:hypothetical protein
MNRFWDTDDFGYPIGVANRLKLFNHLAGYLDRNIRDGSIRMFRRMHSEFQMAIPFDRREVDDRALFRPSPILTVFTLYPVPA